MTNKITKKKTMIVILSLMLILTAAFPALAGNPETNPVITSPPPLPDYAAYNAIIKEVLFEKDSVVGILADADGSEEMFHIFNDTIVIDNENTTAADPKSLKAGDMVFIYGGMQKTFSLPPQSRAMAILTNIGNKAPARYMTVQDMKMNDRGDLVLYDTNGEYVVTVGNETLLLPYLTKQIVLKDDIKVGSKVLVWSEIMTLSLPAQMNADTLMLLPPSENDLFASEITLSLEEEIIYVNYQNITATWHETFLYKHNTTLIPLRRVAEAIGYEVEWIPDGRKIKLTKGDKASIIQIGNLKYDGKNLSVAPELINSRTFVPIDFFESLLNIQVKVL